MSWAESSSSTNPSKRQFSRRLGNKESAFAWYSHQDGAYDCVLHCQIAVDADHVLYPQRVKNIWTMVKQRYPLLAARVVERGAAEIDFVVDETRIYSLLPGEFVMDSIEDPEAVKALHTDYFSGPRKLTSNLVSHLRVISIPPPYDANDGRLYYEIVLLSTHIVTDAFSAIFVLRTFCELIAKYPEHIPIEELPSRELGKRLEVTPAVDELFERRDLPTPRRRWRRAIADVIVSNHEKSRLGGHTLPNSMTPDSKFVPASGRRYDITIDATTSRSVIRRCRQHGFTFGNAINVLCQIAHTTLLRRLCFERGVISKAELEWREKQPMFFNAPMDMRGYFPEEWRKNGGDRSVFVANSNYRCVLPHMPRASPSAGRRARVEDVMPRSRFVSLCHSQKKQMSTYQKHPLLLEMQKVYAEKYKQERLDLWMKWQAMKSAGTSDVVPVEEKDRPPMSETLEMKEVLANMVTTLGSIQNLLPLKYSHSSSSNTPSIEITNFSICPRAFPTEFYLLSSSFRDELTLTCLWDGNCYNDALAIEWTEEVRRAVKYYLADERQWATDTYISGTSDRVRSSEIPLALARL